jgi:hypothetical protein
MTHANKTLAVLTRRDAMKVGGLIWLLIGKNATESLNRY